MAAETDIARVPVSDSGGQPAPIDVFISYAHLDNQPLHEGLNGWVTELHNKLALRLPSLLGRMPVIWRDPRLERYGPFDEALFTRISRCTAFITVVSPLSLRSEWCRRELSAFVEACADAGGVPKTLFKVVKTPVPAAEQPSILRRVLGHEFFEVDVQSNRVEEYTFDFGPDRRYMARLEDLSYALRDVLAPIESDGIFAEPARSTTVFLADTTRSLKDESLQLRRMLEQRGHTVLPDRPLALDRPTLEAEVQSYLERSGLSIHLIGREFALIPEGAARSELVPDVAGQSVVELQLVLAAECRRRAEALDQTEHQPFSSLIWLPEGLIVEDPVQHAFIDALRANIDRLGIEDLLETRLHELVEHVQDRLQPERETFGVHAPILYLLCEPEDRDEIAELAEYLYEREVEVDLPLFDGDEDERSAFHRELLCMCDALLIFYGRADEAHFRKHLSELRQIQRRPGPTCHPNWRATGIYVTDPVDDYKTALQTQYVDEVIKAFGGFSPETIDRFLRRLQPRLRS